MTTPYPVKKHTRTVSATFFDHVIGLFDQSLTSSIILGLQNESAGTVTLMDFMNIPPDEFNLLEYEGKDKASLGLTRAELRLVKNIHTWINYEGHTCPGIDFGQLEMEDYDNYQLSIVFKPPLHQHRPLHQYHLPVCLFRHLLLFHTL